MRFLMFLSDALIPILVFYIVGFGILMKKNVYDDFLKGAKEGIQTVVGILPTLVGLMVAVGILRASGLLDFISTTCMGWTKHIGIPSELIPIAIVKMFSSSAATGLLVDLYKEAGCDSFVGMLHRDHFLYHVNLFYVGKSTKDRLYASGGIVCYAGRNCGKYLFGGTGVDFP